jgi:hypothetical protein
MQLRSSSPKRGSVLIVTLAFVGIAALAIVGYLSIVRSQAAFVSRSQAWNAALALGEAGAEDGFALLNKNIMSIFTPAYEWTNNLVSDGWSPLLNGVTSRTNRAISGGYYIVTITIPPGGGAPTLESEGYTTDNSLLFTSADGEAPFFAAAGVTLGTGNAVSVARRVRVPTMRTNLFNAGISAKNGISLSGGQIIDSFDSGDTNYSTGGMYDAAKATDHAIVATDSTNANCISSSGGAKVKGFIKTGPGGSANFGGSGSAGDAAWVNGGNSGVQSGHYKNDMNVFFPDVPTPPAGGIPPLLGIVGGTNYTYALSGTIGKYQMPTLTMSSSQNMIIYGGEVTLYIFGSINMSGQSYIYIAPGASLRLFCGGPNASVGGGGIINVNGTAAGFSFYGLPGCTSISYAGGGSWIGTLYAPEAAVTMGGGNDTTGAFVASSFTRSGNANMHIDEGLYRNGAGSPYIARSWTEVPPQ